MKLTYPWQLYHWHFEISSKCTLKCPRCPRTEYKDKIKLNEDLSLEFFQKLLTPDLLKNTVKRITMCGDIGDPIYNKEYLDICRYIKETNPNIHLFTITNGSYRSKEWWEEFASICNDRDSINFSVDGYDNASNNLYRINSDWSSIILGMSIMAKQSPAFVHWAPILFSFNEDHIDDIIGQARTIGCDTVQFTRSTKFGSVYGDAYGGTVDPLEPKNPQHISKTHRYERYSVQLSGRRLDNVDYLATNKLEFLKTKEQYDKFVTPMCVIGNRGLYVNAAGQLYPCSWTSFPYEALSTARKTIKFQDSFFTVNKDALNLFKNDLETVLNNPIWDKFFTSLDDPQRAWVECEQKCNTSLVDESYAVGYETN
jgi:MoaA/NifB/PqqE/SkfB family radical SAM enzyme